MAMHAENSHVHSCKAPESGNGYLEPTVHSKLTKLGNICNKVNRLRNSERNLNTFILETAVNTISYKRCVLNILHEYKIRSYVQRL